MNIYPWNTNQHLDLMNFNKPRKQGVHIKSWKKIILFYFDREKKVNISIYV